MEETIRTVKTDVIRKDIRKNATEFCKKAEKLLAENREDSLYYAATLCKNLCSRARTAAKRICFYKEIPQGIKESIAKETVLEYIDNAAEVNESTLKAFLNAKKKKYDSITLSVFSDMMFAVIFEKITVLVCAEKDEGLSFLLRAADRMKFIDFARIFLSFSETDALFSTEKAGVYKDCDRKTKFEYISELVMLSKREKKSEREKALEILKKADRNNLHVGELILKKNPFVPRIYSACLCLMTIIITVLYLALCNFSLFSFAVLPAVLISIYGLVKQILSLCFKNAGNDGLVRLCGEKVKSEKAVIAIMSILYGPERDEELFERLENFYLSDENPNRFYALVCNLPDSDRKNEPSDKEAVSFALGRISALNAKYGEHFGIFIRERRYSRSERKYIGWERKRGAVLELCRFMRAEKTSITKFTADKKFLYQTKYLITLDSDTNLYAGAADELIGTMLHPMNKPKIASGRVVRGHAIVQPHIGQELKSAAGTEFSSITAGNGGIDSYATASFDIYENVFGNGSFCGKGILDIDVFLEVCDGFFPRERILSHDLLEGNLLGAAIASDITLTDSSPQTALAYYTRHHRWLRGDLQTIPYLFPRVKNSFGKRIKNPMDMLSKYKITENLINAIAPFTSVFALILAGFLAPKYALVTTLFALSYLIFPIIYSLISSMVLRGFKTALRRFHSRAMPLLTGTFLYAFYRISALAYESFLFADASIRTLYRFLISKRNFLNWKTAASADREENELFGYIIKMWPSSAVGTAALLLPSVTLKILGLLWLTFPVLSWTLSQKNTDGKRVFHKHKDDVHRYASRMWGFFRDLVNEETNYLPPDNYQISPTERIAYRTSPTNIGLYLDCLIGARDLGFITSSELEFYARNTANTIANLPKWRGNLYNWYDIKTLEILGDPFVSTVDSGNFVCAVSAFCEGLKEYAGESPKILDVLKFYENIVKNTDLESLFDKNSRLFYIGYDVKRERFSESYYDVFMSEARMTSFYAVASGQVPREHFFAAARPIVTHRGYSGVASWSGTAFEYFMPALFIPVVPNSLSDEALQFAFKIQKNQALKRNFGGKGCSVFGVSESGYWYFDAELNYQYKAFGLGKLSLDPDGKNAQVISPYSTFLMLRCGADECIENLRTLEKIGAYGEYGFFEAVDFEKSRVGAGYGIVKSFMAHHIGMSFIASLNFLKDDIFVKRFMRVPKMRASAELLCEKIAVNAPAIPSKSKDKRKDKPITAYSKVSEKVIMPKKEKYSLISPQVAMLSNNKFRILASSSGHIAVYNGNYVIFRSDFDKFTLGSGLRFYIVADGNVLPLVPLESRLKKVNSKFDFSSANGRITYRAEHDKNGKKAVTELNIRLSGDREMCEFSVNISGDFSTAYAFVYGEPIMEAEKAYLSHRSFSNLFLESKYETDEDILIFSRRSKNGTASQNFLGIKAYPEGSGISFDTKRDKILTLLYNEKDIAELSKKVLSKSEGAMIIPALAMRTGNGKIRREFDFVLAAATSEDELKYILSENRKILAGSAFSDVDRLQRGASGINDSSLKIEKELLRAFLFGTPKNKNAVPVFSSKDIFWKRGISGENKMLLLTAKDGDEIELAFLASILSVFKYMCIRGYRFDILIIYLEKDSYNRSVKKRIESCIFKCGCKNFLNRENGIFPLWERDFSDEELAVIKNVCEAEISLSEGYLMFLKNKNEVFELSEKAEKALLHTPDTRIFPLNSEMDKKILEENQNGYFTDDGYVVKKPHGSIPYSYVMANKIFGTVLSENSLGFTYFENSALGKLTPHTADNMTEDSSEKIIARLYSNDGYEDFDLAACAEKVSFCGGRAEYQGRVLSLKYRLCVEVFAFSPIKKYTLKYENSKSEKIKIIFMATPCLNDKPLKKSEYIFESNNGDIIVNSIFEKRLSMSISASFPKPNYCFDIAGVITDGLVFSGEEEFVSVFGVFEDKEKEISFFLGALTDSFTLDDFREKVASEAEFLNISEPFESIKIKTENPVFDLSVNFLFPYQTLYSRLLARSGFYQVGGAFGYRDQLQDTLSFIETSPELCLDQIKKCASHQYFEGDVAHWWHRYLGKETGLRSRYSDDLLWLPYALTEYIDKTGNAGVLYEKEVYLSSPLLDKREKERYEELYSHGEGTLYEHAEKAIKLALERGFGKHGLLKFGGGDWNDGMNAVGKNGKGESVWLSEFCAIICFKFSKLAKTVKGEDDERYFLEIAKKLYDAVQDAFQGEWYLRGYYDDGSPLGQKGNMECEVDSLSQSFAVFMDKTLFGYVSDRSKSALEAAFSRLYDKKTGVMKLLDPPFDDGEERPGYIKGYLPGIRENGGQYTHAAVWAAMALLESGNTDKGLAILESINPAVMSLDNGFCERYLLEPYALAGDVYSHPQCTGRGGWSFYTGAAAWYKKAVLECVFGYCSSSSGFFIEPHMNEKFDGAVLSLNTNETSYTVKYLFSDKSGIVIDGRIVETDPEKMSKYLFVFDKGNHMVDYCIKNREE